MALASGTERGFSVTLPYNYANTYFQLRTKETNATFGGVKLTSKSYGCDGASAWFCNANTSRITNVVKVENLNKWYVIYYNSSSEQGNSVKLGLEDLDIDIIPHSVSGVVNYN